MIGTNELMLNEATMIEALQQWLDGKIPQGAPLVKSIKQCNSSFEPAMFNIMVSGEKSVGKTGARDDK
jgi:hypothetical protein